MTDADRLLALTEALRICIPTLKEILASHRDKKCAEYNACEDGPCGWCEDITQLLAALRSQT